MMTLSIEHVTFRCIVFLRVLLRAEGIIYLGQTGANKGSALSLLHCLCAKLIKEMATHVCQSAD
jgi:hypothetical protein